MKKNGFTLLEVLVAIVLVSVAFLGMTRLLFEARKHVQEVSQRSIALNLANDLIGRMTANPQGIADYKSTAIKAAITGEKTCLGISTANTCTAEEMAKYDLQLWTSSLFGSNIKNGTNDVGGLVMPVACIDVTTDQKVTVSIAWRGKQAQTETTEPKKDADDNPVLQGRGTRPCGKGEASFKQVADNDLRRLLEVTTTIGR